MNRIIFFIFHVSSIHIRHPVWYLIPISSSILYDYESPSPFLEPDLFYLFLENNAYDFSIFFTPSFPLRAETFIFSFGSYYQSLRSAIQLHIINLCESCLESVQNAMRLYTYLHTCIFTVYDLFNVSPHTNVLYTICSEIHLVKT